MEETRAHDCETFTQLCHFLSIRIRTIHTRKNYGPQCVFIGQKASPEKSVSILTLSISILSHSDAEVPRSPVAVQSPRQFRFQRMERSCWAQGDASVLKWTYMQLYYRENKSIYFHGELGSEKYMVKVKFRDKSDGALHFLQRSLYHAEKGTPSSRFRYLTSTTHILDGILECAKTSETDFLWLIFCISDLRIVTVFLDDPESNTLGDNGSLGKVAYEKVFF